MVQEMSGAKPREHFVSREFGVLDMQVQLVRCVVEQCGPEILLTVTLALIL